MVLRLGKGGELMCLSIGSGGYGKQWWSMVGGG